MTPATGPGGLANESVVFTSLAPACAAPTTTAALQQGLGSYKFDSHQKVLSIPAPGLATLDIDVSIANTATCDDDWCECERCCRWLASWGLQLRMLLGNKRVSWKLCGLPATAGS